ncbi:hypothetical protein Hanom_Chr06g00552911 [Helianthus anomalus]
MFANVKTLNEKYSYKFPRFIQMILEKKYPKLPVTVKTYDAKMMNHLVFTWIIKSLEIMLGSSMKTNKNAIVAEEHDVEIIEAHVGVQEPIENVDLTRIDSEEDVGEDRMIDDEEEDEHVDESETETEIMDEGLTAETEDISEPVHMSAPHVEHVSATEAATVDHSLEEPTADLPPRKRSRRDPRLSGDGNVQTTSETSNPSGTSQPKINYTPSELNPKIVDFILNERSAMYMPAPKPGEGSSSGPSESDVIRAVELLQVAAVQNETTILMRRISTLEEDKIFKDAQIASLMEELVVKNQKINEFETNLGALSAIVMDMKQKLEGRFPKEFADPPKESTAEEREQQRKSMKVQ